MTVAAGLLWENRTLVPRERSKPPMSCSIAIVQTGRSRCLPRELVGNLRNLPSDILDWENMIYIAGFYGARRHIRPLGRVGRLGYSNAAGFLDFPQCCRPIRIQAGDDDSD